MVTSLNSMFYLLVIAASFCSIMCADKTETAKESADLKCWSCSSLDDTYTSRYTDRVTISSLMCNDPFDAIPTKVIARERAVECIEESTSMIITYRPRFCLKVVGFEKNLKTNVTARGCFMTQTNFIPDRDEIISDSIKFGDYHISGVAYFCEGSLCNSAPIATQSHCMVTLLIWLAVCL